MGTKILKIYNPKEAAVQEAAQLLDQGALVAFPTETVYGVGCRVESNAIQRLNNLKGRPADKRYTLHVGNDEQLSKYVPVMNAQARKLVSRMLPGPLTIVFELNKKALTLISRTLPPEVIDLLYLDGTIGIRYPAHSIACAILSLAQFPVVAPSANLSGQSPAVNTDQVLSYFNGKIECIVESPNEKVCYSKNSTVVKAGKGGIQILRSGAVPDEKIRELATIRILFVCTGNTCRSPMAEGICRKYFADILGCSVDELGRLGYIINSAGVVAFDDAPASRYAIEVSRAFNVDLSRHRSRLLTKDLVEQSDVIYVMSPRHKDNVVQLCPSAIDRCFLLDKGGTPIEDPVGFDREVYEACFRQIQSAIVERMDELL